MKKLDEHFKAIGIVCPIVNYRKSRKSSKGASPKKKPRSKTVSVSNLNIYIDSTQYHPSDLKSPSAPRNKNWAHSKSDNAVLTISQKLDEKLLEMKWNVEQAEKESKVLQDALHLFDDWLRLVESRVNPMPKDLSEAEICAKAKELKFINDMCDRVERYFDVTSIKRLLLILEHRFEKAVKTKVKTSENNSISKPNSCREKYKEKPSPKRQYSTGITKTSEQRDSRVHDKHQTEKGGGKKGADTLTEVLSHCKCSKKFCINAKTIIEQNGELYRQSVGKKLQLLQDFLDKNDPCRRKRKSG